MKRIIVVGALALAGICTAAVPAQAGSSQTYGGAVNQGAFPGLVKLRPKLPAAVAVGDAIEGRAKFRTRFSFVRRVCLTFTFVGDLLDPDEVLTIDLDESYRGFGFINVGSTSSSERMICVEDPIGLELFMDGRQEFTIHMETGAVTISNLDVTVFGASIR